MPLSFKVTKYMDYLEHFNLTDRPFKNTYDGRFFYRTTAARQIFQNLKAETTPPLLHLKGWHKVGKTSILHRLTDELKKTVKVALILNPHLTLAEMLRQTLTDFGQSHKISPKTPEKELLSYYQNEVSSFLAKGLKVLLAVDNVDELPPARLADLYSLIKLEPKWQGQVRLLLCGTPERPWPVVPNMLIELKELELPPLNESEVEEYLTARLKVTGANSLFSRAAIKALGEYSEGRPEFINRLAERALIVAWSSKQWKVEKAQVKIARASLKAPQNINYDSLAETASNDVPRPSQPTKKKQHSRKGGWLILGATLALGVICWSRSDKAPLPLPSPELAEETAPNLIPSPLMIPPDEDLTIVTDGTAAPQLPALPSQLLTLPQGSLVLVVDQTTNTGRLWQGDAQKTSLKAEITTPVFKTSGLYVFGRPRSNNPFIFQYPPARNLPLAEAEALWPRLITLLPQNILPVIVAPGTTLNTSKDLKITAAIKTKIKAWVQAQQYRLPDTLASLYASSFQFFELSKSPRHIDREDFRQALNSEARTSGEVKLTTSQPLIIRDPKKNHLVWAIFNIKYESKLRNDLGLRVLIFEKPLMGQNNWLIRAELWLPEKSLKRN
jgi:type II secretory pathway predicted ATPase ExeA